MRKDIEDLFDIANSVVSASKLLIHNSASDFICSDFSVTGYGWLNDHGFNSHGWLDRDMHNPMNLHRGQEFVRLRKFFLDNIDLKDNYEHTTPLQILISKESSLDLRRRMNFSLETNIAKQLAKLNQGKIFVKSFYHHNTPLKRLLQLSSKASIYITSSGGGSFPAFFMPRGSVLIIYGDKNMHLDSDLYNNLSQIKVHWMSIPSRNKDVMLFQYLLCDEIENLLLAVNSSQNFHCKLNN
jgi:hypothetical protein